MSFRDDEEDDLGYDKKLSDFLDDSEDWLNEKDDVLKDKKSVSTEMDEDEFNDDLGLFRREEQDDFNLVNDKHTGLKKSLNIENPFFADNEDRISDDDLLKNENRRRETTELTMKIKTQIYPRYNDGEYPNKGLPWLKEDEQTLIENPDMPYKELERYFGRSARSIKQKAHTLRGSQSLNEGKPEEWTKTQKQILQDNMDFLSGIELSNLTGKSINAVRMMITRIRGSPLDKKWDKKEDNIIDKNWIIENDKHLALKLNANQNSIRNRRIDRGHIRLNTLSYSDDDLAVNPDNLSLLDKEALIRYFGHHQGFKEQAKELNRAPNTLKSPILDTGAKIPEINWTKFKNHLTGRFNVDYSDFLDEVITGSLLGDANIQIQTKNEPHKPNFELREYKKSIKDILNFSNRVLRGEIPNIGDIKNWNLTLKKIQNINTACFRIGKSIQEFSWMQTLEDLFNPYLGSPPKVSQVNNLDRKLQWKVSFQTLSSVQLAYYWNKWYTPKRTDEDGNYLKIIPESLTELTPNIVLHWYTGDGSLSPNSFRLYTNNFIFEDQVKLQQMLNEIGIEVIIDENDYGYFLRLSLKKENLSTFFDYLSQAGLYEKAVQAFPYKFEKNYSHKEHLNKMLIDYPEFTDPNAKFTWEDLKSKY